MARDKRIIKVDVEKSEYISCKTVTIKNMKNEIIAEMNVFADGSIFIDKCLDLYVSEPKIKKIVLEAPEDKYSNYYHHILMNDEFNTQKINRENRNKKVE